MHETVLGQSVTHERAALGIAAALLVDMAIVAQCRGGRGLHGRRRDEPGVLAGLDEVGDEIGVARVEADTHAGQVRALRDAVHRQHTVEPTGQDRCRIRRELAVALVARDQHTAVARPGSDPSEVGGVGGRCRRVAGLVDPQDQSARRVGITDGVDVEMPLGVERNRHGATTREDRAHLVTRVRDRGIQHRVPPGIPQPQEVRQGGHELLRADARTHMGALDGHTETSADPGRRGLTQRDRSRRRRVAVRYRERIDRRSAGDFRHRIARCPDRAVDHSPGQ